MARISEKELELRAKARWREDKQIWQLNITPPEENRKSIYSKTPGDKGRNEVAKKALDYLNNQQKIPSGTLDAAYTGYIAYLKSTFPETTWYLPDSLGRTWVIPALGSMRLDAINHADIQRVVDAAAAKGRKQKTLKHIRTEIRKFFVWCYKNGLCEFIPDSDLITISHGARGEEKIILTPDETLTFFESDMTLFNGKPAKEPLIHLYRYGLLTGMRPGEKLALDSSDIIDGGHKTIIDEALNDSGNYTDGKNKTAIRTIINCELAKNELLAQQAEYPTTSTNEPFFGCCSQRYYRDRLEIYCDANGIRRITPYNFRHTFESYRKRPDESELTKAKNLYVGHMEEIPSYIHEVEGYPELVAQEINRIFLAIFEYARQKRNKIG